MKNGDKVTYYPSPNLSYPSLDPIEAKVLRVNPNGTLMISLLGGPHPGTALDRVPVIATGEHVPGLGGYVVAEAGGPPPLLGTKTQIFSRGKKS